MELNFVARFLKRMMMQHHCIHLKDNIEILLKEKIVVGAVAAGNNDNIMNGGRLSTTCRTQGQKLALRILYQKGWVCERRIRFVG